MEGWIKIFTTPDLLQAKLAEDILKQEGIESHIVNKADSMLPVGEAELYALPDRVEQAIAILRARDFLKD